MARLTEQHFYRDVPDPQRRRLEAFRAAHPQQERAIDGVRWTYLTAGAGGVPLLLLPGAALRAEPGFPLIAAFAGERRVVAPDYPPLDTLAGLVRGLAGLLAAEGIARAHIFGGSYGGLVAQAFARAHPALVRSLILANTPAPAPCWRWPIAAARGALAALPFGSVRALLLRIVPRVTVAPAAERAFWRAYQAELLTQHLGRAELLALLRAGQDALQQPLAAAHPPGNPPLPVLLLGTAPPRLRRRYPQADIHLFPGPNHTPWLTDQEGYVATAGRFLTRADAAPDFA